jgi:hypothetical protein
VLSGKHSPFLKSKPCHPLGWHGFYFSDYAISVDPTQAFASPCVCFRELLNTRSALGFNMSASSDWLGVILLSSIRFQQPER